MEHRPRTQHRNADGLSKRTNDYRWREQQLEMLPPLVERWNFLSQDKYERLPTARWFAVQGRIIPNHPDLPSHLRKMPPTPPNPVQQVICRTQRTKRHDKQQESWQAPLPSFSPPMLHAHEDWIDVPGEASHDYLLPTHEANVASVQPTHWPRPLELCYKMLPITSNMP